MSEIPSQNDFVELTFEGEFEHQSPVQGQVVEVDEECEDVPMTNLMFVVNDEEGNREVIYAEGVDEDGEEWANVSVKNMNVTLGENAEYQIAEF